MFLTFAYQAYVEECERQRECVAIQQSQLPRAVQGHFKDSFLSSAATPAPLVVCGLPEGPLEIVFQDVCITYGGFSIHTREPRERVGDIEEGARRLQAQDATVELPRTHRNLSTPVLPTIKNFNVLVKSGECIGVVGRTGAGESSPNDFVPFH